MRFQMFGSESKICPAPLGRFPPARKRTLQNGIPFVQSGRSGKTHFNERAPRE